MATTVSAHAICKLIRTSFVRFSHVHQLLQKLDDLYKYNCTNEEAENISLLGESGVGKTRLLKKFCNAHPRIEHKDFTEIPVLYTKVPPQGNIDSLASAMLQALGSPFWDKGKPKQLVYQLKCLITKCKVRMIILDEMNHLVDKRGIKTHHHIADWIKELSDEMGVPFVLAGIPRAERLLHTNDQMRSRAREVIIIQQFSVESDAAVKEFQSVLKSFATLMDGLPTIDLSHKTMARRMAFATDGRLRDIRSLLVRAVQLAFDQPSAQITMPILANAFRQVIYSNGPDDRNPFCENFKELPLTGLGEPFAPREE